VIEGFEEQMAFKLNLTPAQRARIQAERSFAQACYAADDIWLGRAILKLATDIRDAYPNLFPWERRGDGYSGALVWEIAPEIARRLGVLDFARGRRPYACQNEGELALRVFTCNAIFGSRRSILRDEGRLSRLVAFAAGTCERESADDWIGPGGAPDRGSQRSAGHADCRDLADKRLSTADGMVPGDGRVKTDCRNRA
jgi:hypothetical protein